LLAVHLPFDAVVHALMTELGLTIAEATRATTIARHRSLDEVVHHAGA
jgi:urease accessory protein UreE